MNTKLSTTIEELRLGLKQKDIDLVSQSEILSNTRAALEDKERILGEHVLMHARAEQLHADRLQAVEREAVAKGQQIQVGVVLSLLVL